ncbi:metal ABC transporter substrate-binding protein [Lysinibacter cavernae]|uniref:Zinc/manganese transport system substrate-binding protein/manganese/iron transport system substrate-binding protein n=1 Tax=Lysinibacter cavernae TaxID=1640652 RepID=A0A7X5R2V6_9MICO|nr:metal ABC transporter substrate-binding protein [Lysinibacter cavernae]NIH54601.1 zinc/manganese transport system substrate-binding protein/manganese/iron transport system substrate-binding protein [Lysinibacter cavernae]
MKRYVIAIPALLLATALAATGCTASSSASGSGDTLKVVATTTQVGDFTKNVGGDDIEFTQLLAPGASAHHFDPTPADLAKLAAADVLVTNGAGLEEFLDSAIEASGFHGVTIDSSTGITLSGDHDHDHDHDHGDEDSHEGHEHAEGDDHDHDAESAEGNPHIWTDPANAKIMVNNIAEGLTKAATERGEQDTPFTQNAQAYNTKLDELDSWIQSNVSKVPADQRLVVSNHDAFHYFLDAYDITFVGSIIPSFEDNAEPSATEIDALVTKIKELGVKAIFSESSISDKTATAIAKAAGVEVYSGDNALFGDSLGAPGSGGDTYILSTIHNTQVILESWGVTPTPVPAGLE